MAIEKHLCEGGDFHTTTDFLDCAECDAVIPQPKDGDDIVTCPNCGNTNYAHDLADARVEEIVAAVAATTKFRERVKLLREALLASLGDNVAHHLISEVIAEEKGYKQLPTEPASIAKARAALDATDEEI